MRQEQSDFTNTNVTGSLRVHHRSLVVRPKLWPRRVLRSVNNYGILLNVCVAPDGLPRRRLLVDDPEAVDRLGGILHHPINYRMVGGYRPTDALFGVQL